MRSYNTCLFLSNLFHLALIFSKSVDIGANGTILFFFCLSNIPVCVCVYVCLLYPLICGWKAFRLLLCLGYCK